ncbi:hypothetical protein C8A01DRAFT_39765 [Parachaetomium inaequale]|uniref:Uncharacterized protein n=1 Tax=Parachaetomium inaequale TaxID=2588326 RepID=A0AAN6PAG0_9PEZI|nr:hypothetical protein C8A01DRAFT_39765 [Parachaetomium inaequale]
MKYSASLVVAAGLAAAQSSSAVVNVLLPSFGTEAMVASVISAGPTATSYLVNCPTDTSSEDCGLGDGLKILYGSSTMTYGMTFADTNTYTANCKLDPAANTATCEGGVISDGSTSTVVAVFTDYSTFIVPVTVTAGAEKLSGATEANTNTAASATTGPAASNPTTLATTAAPTNSQQGSTGGAGQTAASSSSTTSTSTGGMPRVTQNAVIMGAAALVGGAMFL